MTKMDMFYDADPGKEKRSTNLPSRESKKKGNSVHR